MAKAPLFCFTPQDGPQTGSNMGPRLVADHYISKNLVPPAPPPRRAACWPPAAPGGLRPPLSSAPTAHLRADGSSREASPPAAPFIVRASRNNLKGLIAGPLGRQEPTNSPARIFCLDGMAYHRPPVDDRACRHVITGLMLCPHARQAKKRSRLTSLVRDTLCITMKTASIRDLRNHFPKVRKLLQAEGEILLTESGAAKYRLSAYAPPSDKPLEVIDYFSRLLSYQPTPLSPAQSQALHEDNRGDR